MGKSRRQPVRSKRSISRRWLVRAALVLSLVVSQAAFLNTSLPPQAIPAVTVDQSGHASLNIGFAIPEGQRGLTPALGLSYSSGAGNGEVGVGWSLQGFSAINRDSFYQIKYDGTDHYTTSDAGRLRVAGDGRYHAEQEDFKQYNPEGTCGDAPCTWRVRDASGQTHVYGGTPDSRIEAPDHNGSVRVWLLSEVKNSFGDGYAYAYNQPGDGSYRLTSVTYLDREIDFDYDTREDAGISYAQSVPEPESVRLSAVRVRVNGSVVREYDLSYTMSATTKRSLLTQIARKGSNSWGSEDYRNLNLEYSQSPFSVTSFASAIADGFTLKLFSIDPGICSAGQLACLCTMVFPAPWCVSACIHYLTFEAPICLAGGTFGTFPAHMAGDVNGDGRLDIINLVGGVDQVHAQVSFLGESGIIGQTTSPVLPMDQSTMVVPADIDGDGRTDLAYGYAGTLWVLYSTGNGFRGPYQFANVATAPQPLNTDPNVEQYGNQWFVDLNGDGRADFVRLDSSASNLYVSLSRGDSFEDARAIHVDVPVGGMQSFVDLLGSGTPQYVRLSGGTVYVTAFDSAFSSSTTIAYGVGATGSDRNRWWADVNGDGRPDLVAFQGDTLYAMLFTGAGFAAPQSISVGTAAQNRGSFADIDGDGTADFVYTDGSTTTVLYSTAQGISNSRSDNFSGSNDYDSAIAPGYFVGDTNGDGKEDFIFLNKNGTLSIFTQNPNHSDLLVRATDNAGQEVTINYAPKLQTSGAVDLNLRTYPDIVNTSAYNLVTDVTRHLGFRQAMNGPVDDVDHTTYGYLSAALHLGPRDQQSDLGFKIRSEHSDMSGFTETTTYRQDYPFMGVPQAVISTNAQGQIISDSAIGYDVVQPSDVSRLVRSRSRTTHIYMDGAPLQTNSLALDYDDYGNITRQSETKGSTRVTTTSYAIDTDNWFLRRPEEVTQQKDGVTYDKKAFSYSGGAITEARMLLLPQNKWITTTFTNNSHGNPVSITDPVGSTVQLEYDSQSLHAIAVTDPLGHRAQSSFDSVNGQVIATTDANGQVTKKKYDGYGRLTEVSLPNDSWTERHFYYNTGDSLNQYEEVRKHDDLAVDGYLWDRVYSDLRGRIYKRESSAGSDGNGNNYTLVDLTTFDAQGRTATHSRPYIPQLESPQFSTYDYSGPDGRLSRIVAHDGSTSTISYSGNTVTTVDGAGRVRRATQDADGQLLQKIDPMGGVTQYSYDAGGHVVDVSAPGGDHVQTSYDSRGRVLSRTTPDSGTSIFDYDDAGRLKTTTDGGGKQTTFSYDSAGRILRISTGEMQSEIEYAYDESGVANGTGRLTSVHDITGTTRVAYDSRGQVSAMVRTMDDLTLSLKSEYDSLGRQTNLTLPDGSVLMKHYGGTGQLDGIRLDGHTIVSYSGPRNGDTGNPEILRQTGNGVQTAIAFDPARQRPLAVKTTLPSGKVVQQWTYTYDTADNITAITDSIDANRSSSYSYDSLNRLIESITPDGAGSKTEEYAYANNGSLITKGAMQLAYGDAAHRHAVTSAKAGSQTIDMAYDDAGNMTARDAMILRYNRANQMVGTLNNGESYDYAYDYTGNRAIKKRVSNGMTVYNLGGMYEIAKLGNQSRHTIYIHGARGELVSQYTRDGVQLTSTLSKNNARTIASLFELTTMSGLSAYYHIHENPRMSGGSIPPDVSSAIKGLLILVQETMLPPGAGNVVIWMRQHERKIELAFVLLLFILMSLGVYHLWSSGNLRSRIAFASPLVLFSFVSMTTGCVGIAGTGSDNTPWAALGIAAMTQSTPSVTADPDAESLDFAGAPIPGMYYFHPDHLGSITMLTNASGAIVTGVDMNNGGQSHITYDPYGSINRANSDGPDIFRAKFNGREADPESGLLNYGARFYDPAIGRFTQPDSRIDTLEPGSTDQYAYANNNPVAFNDPSGHNAVLHMFGQIVKHMVGGIRAAGTNIGNGVKNALSGGTFRRHPASLGNTPIGKWNFQMWGETVKQGLQALGAGVALFATAAAGLYAVFSACVAATIATAAAVQVITAGIHMIAAAAAWMAVVATAIIKMAVMVVAAVIYAIGYVDPLGLTGAIIGGIAGGIHAKGNYVAWDSEGAKAGLRRGAQIGTSVQALADAIIGSLMFGTWIGAKVGAALVGFGDAGAMMGFAVGNGISNLFFSSIVGGFRNVTLTHWDFSGYSLQYGVSHNFTPATFMSGFVTSAGFVTQGDSSTLASWVVQSGLGQFLVPVFGF